MADAKTHGTDPSAATDDRMPNQRTRRCRLDIPTIVGRIDPSNSPDDNRPSFGKHLRRALAGVMPGQTPRSSWFTFVLTLPIALQTATPVWAWGRLGHRVTSRLAEKYLNPKAKEAVKALLDEGESIADASLWADEHRRELPKTAPWHVLSGHRSIDLGDRAVEQHVPLESIFHFQRQSPNTDQVAGPVDQVALQRIAHADEAPASEAW
jgi:hypothetical protein